MRAGLAALLVLAALAFAPPARADYARITAFRSEVALGSDGVLDVTVPPLLTLIWAMSVFAMRIRRWVRVPEGQVPPAIRP